MDRLTRFTNTFGKNIRKDLLVKARILKGKVRDIAVLTMNPKNKSSSLTPMMISSLITLLKWASGLKTVEVVCIESSNPDIFSCGIPPKKPLSEPGWTGDIGNKNQEHKKMFNELIGLLKNYRKFTICFANGLTLGEGMELSLSCDLRIGSKKVKFGFEELRKSDIFNLGKSLALFGAKKSILMMFYGSLVGYEMALKLDIVKKVCNRKQFYRYLVRISNKANLN